MSDYDWQGLTPAHFPETPYPEMVQAYVMRALYARRAVEDVLLIRFLAGMPWLLHLLATDPAWAAYADTARTPPPA